MPGEGSRRQFVFSTTLNELTIILFFLLLLLTAFTLAQKEQQSERDREMIGDLSQEIEALKFEREELLEEVRIVRAWLDQQDPERPDDWKTLLSECEQHRKRARNLDEQVAALKEELHQLEEKNRDLEEKATALAAEVQQLQERSRDLEEQAVAYASLLRKCGFDHPPCWVDASGKLQYIYLVTSGEDSLTIQPGWPPSREADVENMPGVRDAVGLHLSLEEFSRLSEPILQWSKDQRPECRHFVQIRDRAVSKEAFKRNLLSIEHYFYKYLRKD